MSIKSVTHGLPTVAKPSTGNKFGIFNQIVIANSSWTIDKSCVLEDTLWDKAVKYDNILTPPAFINQEFIGAEAEFYKGLIAQELTYQGTKEWMLDYSELWETGADLQKINGTYRVFLVDSNGNYMMKRTANGTKYQGLEASVTYITTVLGKRDTPTMFRLKVSLLSPSDITSGACDVVNLSSINLQRLSLAKLIVDETSIKATGLDFRAVNAANVNEYVSFDALQKFDLTDSTGKLVTNTVTDKGNGNYSLTFVSTPLLGTLTIGKPYINYWKSDVYMLSTSTSTCVAYEDGGITTKSAAKALPSA